MTEIKICGLFRLADTLAVNAAQPDYAGFVFAPSRRRIDYETAKAFRAAIYPTIKTVGVFVNEDPAFIKKLVVEGIIDLIQLHGDESLLDCRRLAKLAPLIKAFPVADEKSLDAVPAYRPFATPLFDADVGDRRGGQGSSFNWELVASQPKPFFLAGGLNADNVVTAIKRTGATAVDLSSGVESDGLKDERKIVEIVKQIRRLS